MAKSGRHRIIGNLICYAIKNLYFSANQSSRGDFVFSDSQLKGECLDIMGDHAKRESFAKEFNYNKNEMADIQSITSGYRHFSKMYRLIISGYNGLSITAFNPTSKSDNNLDYESSGAQAVKKPASNTTVSTRYSEYKLLPRTMKLLNDGSVLTPSKMLIHGRGCFSGRNS